MIFPLPFTEFEHFMLADDRPSHPMVFYLRLRLHGELQREALEQSVAAATARHPLLRALVESKGRKAWFVESHEQPPSIRWESDPDLDVVRGTARQDIRQDSGVRVTVCQAEGQATLWLAFPHVCCDGLGAMQFAEDLLTTYTNAITGEKSPLPALDENQLLDRNVFTSSRWTQWLRWPMEVLGIFGTLEYFLHRPMPLRADAAEVTTDAELPALASCRQTLDKQHLNRLLDVARAENVTLNDILLRDLFKAAQQWLDETNPEPAQGHLRIVVPMSLRTSLHEQMPATNCVGMVNVDRRVDRWLDPGRMLRVLGWEMRVAKRLRLAVTMIRVVGLVRWITGRYSRLQRTDRCMASCVLSNLGIVFRDRPKSDKNSRHQAVDVALEDVVLETIELLPPVRPCTGAAVGVTSYAGQLTLSILYDRRLLGPTGGPQLLDQLISQLKDTAKG
jgi:NRPS condensation-like uncharacterized protein